ncbi:hypothetical protein AAFF_G00411520 [Aldrovandia affinis]|uniref:A kinase-anchoring proteins AKAP-5 and AKAP-12 calmodulin (CaM)-binding domain-containing protein n=1 Tax=Aldrovandia affinis TaxID=143900 RepID=A0AAD7SBB0_9TELE|nr:hypothetical protein AAFF_G00411520 [Aldrovandia affinis]
MGASTSAQRDGNSQKDATTAEEQNAESNEIEQGGNFDAKLLQKNGQISGLNGKADDQTGGFDGRSGDKILTEVSQSDSVLVSQKDDMLEVMEVLQDEATPKPNIETPEKESASTNSVTPTEKAIKEEPGEAGEEGFTKIFRFVGFKFTLKKDKNGKVTPEQLLTIKKEEGGKVSCSELTEDTHDAKVQEELDSGDPAPKSATVILASDRVDEDMSGQAPEETEKTEKEITPETESSSSPIAQEIQSPIKRFFTQGFFSSLRKRTSFRKSAEDVLPKEKNTEELNEEKAEFLMEEGEKGIEEAPSGLQKEQTTTPEEPKAEPAAEITLVAEGEQNEGEIEFKADSPQTAPEEETITLPADTANGIKVTEEEAEDKVKGQISTDEIFTVLTTEADLLSSQEKAKVHGSPLKKLFAGAGLKKRSKKLKGKREVGTKLTESGEHAAEQLHSSTESGEGQRVESSFSSPEESVEHINGEPLQVETEGDRVTSDEERRRDGIQPWSSFKKLMTPKKRAKRSSESEDEAAEKVKSATLTSTDSAVFTEQLEEPKLSDEEQKIELRMEDPSKKKESSMSWEALLCGGSAKKRARKTSDSDEEEVEEDEEPGRTVGSPLGSSQDGDNELLTSSPDQAGSPSEGDGGSTWASLKRLVTPRRRAKGEDRNEDSTGFSEQVPSDSEIPKEDISFSLKRLIPGRRKKRLDEKQEQISSDEAGKDFGSAEEEDSDTPAVVPLSEFDLEEPADVSVIPKEEVAEKQMNTTETEEAKPELSIPEPKDTVPHVALPITGETSQDTPPIAGTEEQPASWIPTTAELETEEKTECITKHQQLSDIPEEGAIEDTTTPKSTAEEVFQDDTIAEDIVELTSEAVTALEQAPEESLADESTEMVSAVSQLTDSPGTSGDTTPVPVKYEMKQTEMVLQEAVETLSLAVDVLSATKGVDNALLAHAMSETTTICIDLGSQEIEPVWEDILKTSVEGIPEVSEAISSEIVFEAKKDQFEAAGMAQNEVYEAQVEVVKTEDFQEKASERILQNMGAEAEQVSEVEKEFPTEDSMDEAFQVMQMEGEVKEIKAAESVNEQQDLRPVKIAVNAEQAQVELLEGQDMMEDIPMSGTERLIETVVEESVCSQSAQVTEMLVVDGEKEQEDVEKSEANVELAPVAEVFCADCSIMSCPRFIDFLSGRPKGFERD